MNNYESFGSNIADAHKGAQTGASGGKTGAGGNTDYLDKGLNDVEQKYGGKYYDADKVKPANKKITDKVKDKFHTMTGHNMPGSGDH
ncbi:uncharacterized protein BDV14DRAFT_177526 [Aspergillus stella-maris]|uniref:uncharacterized protein n=1 Tax=Aspergillus stella-maris TaxID=1810926 RepID=UPI003CCE0659